MHFSFWPTFCSEEGRFSGVMRVEPAQKKDDGEGSPLKFVSRTMTASERKYSPWKREALVIQFALCRFCLYLQSSERYILFTDRQGMRAAFASRDIQGRLARCLDVFVEHGFEMCYCKGLYNKSANFISRVVHGGRGVEINKEDLVCTLVMDCSPKVLPDVELVLLEGTIFFYLDSDWNGTRLARKLRFGSGR